MEEQLPVAHLADQHGGRHWRTRSDTAHDPALHWLPVAVTVSTASVSLFSSACSLTSSSTPIVGTRRLLVGTQRRGAARRTDCASDERLVAPLNGEALRSGGASVPYVLPYFDA